MAVGASKPTVVADADGFFSVKNKMLVSVFPLFVTLQLGKRNLKELHTRRCLELFKLCVHEQKSSPCFYGVHNNDSRTFYTF